MELQEPAPAKINLALHVRGKLSDGRHRLETIFAFCTDGDRVTARPADELSLQVEGVRAVASFHPRFLLDRPSNKALAWRDLLLLMEEEV